MTDFISFVTSLFSSVSEFLMTEPIKWFVGIFLVAAVGALVKRIITL